MATLTADELELIRLDLGDDCSSSTISNDLIQKAWDAADGDQCAAYERIAWWLYAKVKPSTVNLATGGQDVSTAQAKLAYERWQRWANCAGVGRGSIRAGQLVIDIDTPCPDGDPDCRERWP